MNTSKTEPIPVPVGVETTARSVSEAEKEKLRADALEYLRTTGLSQSAFAKELKFSASYVSGLVTGKDLENKGDDFWRTLRNTLARLQGGAWVTVETEGYKMVRRLCNMTRKQRAMSFLTGDAGYGKTHPIKEYCKLYPVETFHVICMGKDNADDFINAIAEEIGVAITGTCSQRVRRIARKFQTMDCPLLILDEAGALGNDKLGIIKDLLNQADDCVGIILAAVGYVYSRLHDGARRHLKNLPEFKRRIRHRRELPKPTGDEYRMLCAANGVEDRKIVDLIVHNSANFSEVRDWVEMYKDLPEGSTIETLKKNMSTKGGAE